MPMHRTAVQRVSGLLRVSGYDPGKGNAEGIPYLHHVGNDEETWRGVTGRNGLHLGGVLDLDTRELHYGISVFGALKAHCTLPAQC